MGDTGRPVPCTTGVVPTFTAESTVTAGGGGTAEPALADRRRNEASKVAGDSAELHVGVAKNAVEGRVARVVDDTHRDARDDADDDALGVVRAQGAQGALKALEAAGVRFDRARAPARCRA